MALVQRCLKGARPVRPGTSVCAFQRFIRADQDMDSSQLKTWQAKKLDDRLRPTLGYLFRLAQRMQKQGFPDNDKLYRLTVKSYEALHQLCVETHYLSCQSGVGQPDKD